MRRLTRTVLFGAVFAMAVSSLAGAQQRPTTKSDEPRPGASSKIPLKDLKIVKQSKQYTEKHNQCKSKCDAAVKAMPKLVAWDNCFNACMKQ